MNNTGKVIRVLGPVVDVRFENYTPKLYDMLITKAGGKEIALEVEAYLENDVVRTISMEANEGLTRGAEVIATGAPIRVPVGEGTLGRVMNVLGKPIDDKGPIEAAEYRPIHRKAPKFSEQSGASEMLETGIKVIDLMTPYARGKIRLSAAPAWANGAYIRAYRNIAASMKSPLYGRRQALPRGNDMISDMDESGTLKNGSCVRADERAARLPYACRADGADPAGISGCKAGCIAVYR